MRRRLGVTLHSLSDGLHVRAHRLMRDPDWRARNGVDVELFREAQTRMRNVAAVLDQGDLTRAGQQALASHLRGFHQLRRGGCPLECPFWTVGEIVARPGQ